MNQNILHTIDDYLPRATPAFYTAGMYTLDSQKMKSGRYECHAQHAPSSPSLGSPPQKRNLLHAKLNDKISASVCLFCCNPSTHRSMDIWLTLDQITFVHHPLQDVHQIHSEGRNDLDGTHRFAYNLDPNFV